MTLLVVEDQSAEVSVPPPMKRDQNEARVEFLRLLGGWIPIEDASVLFDSVRAVAGMRYETDSNRGFMHICSKTLQPDLSIRFMEPQKTRNIRGLRKLLQISNSELWLVCDGLLIHGFSLPIADKFPQYSIRFFGNGVWQLERGDIALPEVRDEPDHTLVSEVTEEGFYRVARQVFGRLTDQSLRRLWQIALAARRQLRGTNLLISSQAATEAERLKFQCTRTEPTLLIPNLIERVTSIDGTVILDTEGICYAIGAILDGLATDRGDRTRGGRYNSALMFVESRISPSLLIVVSQDGTVDLVTKSELNGEA